MVDARREGQLAELEQEPTRARASRAATSRSCRSCEAPLVHTFVDLGSSPLCQRHIEAHRLDHMEPTYPLIAYVCDRCWLVQLGEYVSPEGIFAHDYAYFSSYSDSWLAHARAYCEMAVERFGLGPSSFVVEMASNDGYLLRNFVARGIPALGIEPARNVAEVAQAAGIPTLVAFFGRDTARRLVAERGPVDLLIGNNVLAHVPDLNDFVAGMKLALARGGRITMEFPHLMRLIDEVQFDTIYHEHFSYFSLLAVSRVFARHELELFDVEELPTHGGSLRIYARHAGEEGPPPGERVAALLERERAAGYEGLEVYQAFGERVKAVKRKLLRFLIEAREQGKKVVGYGAPGKGNTLLNYCGVRTDLLEFTVDRSPHKQGGFLPGSRIPILHPDAIRFARPDYVLILPWNLRDEICQQMACVREWGGRFVIPIPEVQVL